MRNGVMAFIVLSSLSVAFATEVLVNNDFESGMSGWTITNDYGKVYTSDSAGYGYDMYFYPSSYASDSWDLQVIQTISVSKGHRYQIMYGGQAPTSSRSFLMGILSD